MFNNQRSHTRQDGRLRILESRPASFDGPHIPGNDFLSAEQTIGVWKIFFAGCVILSAVLGPFAKWGYSQTVDAMPRMVSAEVEAKIGESLGEYKRNQLASDVRGVFKDELRGSILPFQGACPRGWARVPDTEGRILVGNRDATAVGSSLQSEPEVKTYGGYRLSVISELPSFVTVKGGSHDDLPGAQDGVVTTRQIELLSTAYCAPDRDGA